MGTIRSKAVTVGAAYAVDAAAVLGFTVRFEWL